MLHGHTMKHVCVLYVLSTTEWLTLSHTIRCRKVNIISDKTIVDNPTISHYKNNICLYTMHNVGITVGRLDFILKLLFSSRSQANMGGGGRDNIKTVFRYDYIAFKCVYWTRLAQGRTTTLSKSHVCNFLTNTWTLASYVDLCGETSDTNLTVHMHWCIYHRTFRTRSYFVRTTIPVPTLDKSSLVSRYGRLYSSGDTGTHCVLRKFPKDCQWMFQGLRGLSLSKDIM